MTRAERFQNREREKRRKELELSRYSHNLSHKILTLEGKGQLGPELPDAMVSSFQKGSLLDRDTYWQENAKDLNFGQQMLDWVGVYEGKPGMAQWVAKQQDSDMLREVGLKGDHANLEQELKGDRVTLVLNAINKDLAQAGEDPLTLDELDDDQARSLIFYATYLNPTDKKDPGKDAKELINALVKQASSESNGDVAQTIAKLQQVAPLLRVAGEEGQHVLGALMVAKAHAFDSRDELIKVAPDAVLTDDEKSILEFLKRHREEEKAEEKEEAAPEVLEANRSYDVQQVFAKLSPEPIPGHKYWIDHEIPAMNLTPEQLKSLELRKTMWALEGDRLPLNREVFDPAYTLEDNKRFRNAELLTNNDSGIFALAAASAATPEQQMQLYHQLGETIIRTHAENPKLVEDFLNAQTPESKIQFIEFEQDRLIPQMGQKFGELNAAEVAVFEQKFGRKPNPTGQFSPEEQQFIDQARDRIGIAFKEFGAELLANPAQYPDRLLALREIPLAESTSPEQTTLEIDIPATAAVWPERVKALQEALQADPLTLTPEQIRQIEFLGHAVDSAKVVAMLQQTQASPRVEETSVPLARPAPVAKPEVQTPEVLEETAAAQEVSTAAPKKLDEFFQLFDKLDEKTQIQQRQEIVLVDTTNLSEFSTEGRDIKSYEIYQTGDEQKNLAIYDLREDENGRMQHYYNQDNYFLKLLLQENSLSLFSFEQLKSPDLKYGPNTLLAYVLEASKGSVQQEALFKNLFSQVARIYEEHPDLYKEVLSYFTSISEKTAEPIDEMKVIEPLFGSQDKATQRLSELKSKLADKDATFTTQDFADMGLFALPFNLQLIAQQMEVAHESHASAPQPETEPQP